MHQHRRKEALQAARNPVEGVREGELRHEHRPVWRVLKLLGPGLITGASDDDPSGIGTYAVAGASLGYATLWMALITFPLMASVQFISAKIAIVTGTGLATVIRRHYPRWVAYTAVSALAVATTINAGADIGAIAAAARLLVPLPAPVVIVGMAAVIVVLQLWGSYRTIEHVFKWLTLALLAYIGSAIFARPDARQVLLATFVPRLTLDTRFLVTVVAILGTTISPYLWFWQASQEVEEMVSKGQTHLWQRRGTTSAELRYAAWDVNIGMIFSNVVMYFIILASAATLWKAGKTDINSAQQAAEALRPLAGDAAATLFAVGLIGSGMLAVPVLTGSAAYAVSEALGWKVGFSRPVHRARGFYAVIVASTVIGMLMNFVGVNPIDALFWTAVIFGFLSPPLLVLVMLAANDERIMGRRVNGVAINVLGWLTTILMAAAVVALVVTWGVT